ncbi:podocan-like [Latimeria chalumnae]
MNAGLPDDMFAGSTVVTTLVLSNNKLTHVPSDLPASLTRLHLQNNRISRIHKAMFWTQLSLRELYLQNNKLSSEGVDKQAFSKLQSLEYLDLSNNNLTEIPARLPPNIVVLHLGKNKISSVQEDSVSRVHSLEFLLLQNNQLTNRGIHRKAFENMKRLHTLHIFNNRLEWVPSSLPHRLKSLMILHNHITEISLYDFADTYYLTELNLSYNKLFSSKIHRLAFRKLGRLENLDISGNFLTLIPAGLPGSLEVLRLQNNQINSLSSEVLSNLTLLKELYLTHNRIKVGSIAPGTWQEVHSLRLLDLGDNDLSYIPPDLPESLEYLYLHNNRIAMIAAEAFYSTPNIKVIFLRSNRLREAGVPDVAFSDLKYLQLVDTTGNLEYINILEDSKLDNSTEQVQRAPAAGYQETSLLQNPRT